MQFRVHVWQHQLYHRKHQYPTAVLLSILSVVPHCCGACRRTAGGRGEATVYRDKVTGKVISAEEYTEQVGPGSCVVL
jgi:hypothetical protein